jgi:hypothetical protein
MSYGIRERCVMIALAACGGEMSNADLDKQFKLGLDKPQREQLNADKLVVSRKNKRTTVHTLSDTGWRWIEDEMGSAVPARAGAAAGALYALLAALKVPAQRAGGLRQLLSTAVPTDGLAVAAPVTRAAPAEHIRRAYAALAERPGQWVWLRDLRPRLQGMARAEVDAALEQMFLDRSINLTLNEDQGSLTSADREAAIRVGQSAMHLISIE